MKKLLLMTFAFTILMIVSGVSPARAGDWEAIFNGNGDVMSYIYFHQDNAYFIDTDLSAYLETVRYKKFTFAVDLFEETNMGRKYHSNMVFDPNRGQWSFGISGRMEFSRYFLDIQYHHDCFHDIGRWYSSDSLADLTSVYWNTPRIGFGSAGYLSKNKYHQHSAGGNIAWPKKFDYYILARFFAPRGYTWQKHHDYNFTLNTNFNLLIARYKRLGFIIESNNFWVIDNGNELKRQHGLDFDFAIYGNRGAFIAYIGWWPYDDQSIRPKDGKTVFGLHLGF